MEQFWKKMLEVHGKASTNLLQLKTINGSSMRGLCLSRFAAERVTMNEKRMSSAAKGDNTYYFWNMTGRINVDLMQIIKDDKKPEDNTLKFAAHHWLGGGEDTDKIDLSASEMFEYYASGDTKKRLKIAEYCARDCDIPIIQRIFRPTTVSRIDCIFIVNKSSNQIKHFNLLSTVHYVLSPSVTTYSAHFQPRKKHNLVYESA